MRNISIAVETLLFSALHIFQQIDFYHFSPCRQKRKTLFTWTTSRRSLQAFASITTVNNMRWIAASNDKHTCSHDAFLLPHVQKMYNKKRVAKEC